MIEAWGRSFEKIREACEEFNGPLPKLKISENGMMVHCLPCEKYLELMKKNSESDYTNVTDTETGIETDTERRIVALISKNPKISISKMAVDMNMSQSGIRYALGRLRDKGVVERIGAQKNGSWIIKQ